MKQFLQFLKITLALVLFLQAGRASAQCSTIVNDDFTWGLGSWWSNTGAWSPTGLQFSADNSPSLYAQRNANIPAGVTVTLTNVRWKSTSVNNDTGRAYLYFKIGGTVYLTIDTQTYDTSSPTITASNGATITNGATNLPAGGGSGNWGILSQPTTIVFKVPNTANASALLDFTFSGGSSSGGVDDLFVEQISISSTQPPVPSVNSVVNPVCGTPTGTVNLNVPDPAPLYSMDGGAWQTSATFSGLVAGSTHTFRTAYSGSTGCFSSLPSSVTIGPAVANRTVNPASSSPNVCIGTPITNITHTTTGVTGIGTGATGLPAGLTATYASNVVTISGTPNATVIPGSYTYTIPLVGCGTANATGTITVNAKPVANAGADFSITCTTNPTGAAIGATAVTGVTYSWTASTGTAPTGANPTVNPTATTTYTLTATENGCTATDAVVVTVNKTVPVANAGADFTKTCTTNTSGKAIGATAVAGVTYSWTASTGTAPTGANPTVNPTATTTYTLTTTNTASGCTATDTVVVTVETTVPVADAGADFTKTCITNPTGAAIGATAVAGVTYSWTASTGTAPTGANPTVNPTATTTYTLTTTNTASGCTATDTVVVTVDTAAPAAPLLSGTTIANVCDNNFVNLNSLVSNGTTNLKWYTDSAHTAEVTTPTAVTTSGTYYPYNVGSSNGCFSSAASSSVTATVTVCCKATIAPNLNN